MVAGIEQTHPDAFACLVVLHDAAQGALCCCQSAVKHVRMAAAAGAAMAALLLRLLLLLPLLCTAQHISEAHIQVP